MIDGFKSLTDGMLKGFYRMRDKSEEYIKVMGVQTDDNKSSLKEEQNYLMNLIADISIQIH